MVHSYTQPVIIITATKNQ